MRKVDPVRHEAKRHAILEAAVRCFVRDGFRGASIADICAEAKMSAGHLYHYFRSKDAIVDAIVEANLRRAADTFARSVQDGTSVLDVIAAQVTGAGFDHDHRASLLFEMFAESDRNPRIAEALDRHSRQMRSLLVGFLRQGQERGEIDPGLDPEAVAPVLISMVDGAKTLALRQPGVPAGRSTDALRLMVARFLSPPAPG